MKNIYDMLGRRTAAYRLRHYANNPRKENVMKDKERLLSNHFLPGGLVVRILSVLILSFLLASNAMAQGLQEQFHAKHPQFHAKDPQFHVEKHQVAYSCCEAKSCGESIKTVIIYSRVAEFICNCQYVQRRKVVNALFTRLQNSDSDVKISTSPTLDSESAYLLQLPFLAPYDVPTAKWIAASLSGPTLNDLIADNVADGFVTNRLDFEVNVLKGKIESELIGTFLLYRKKITIK